MDSDTKHTFWEFTKQILKAKNPRFTLSSDALDYLHTHIDHYLKEIVEDAEECRNHARRTILEPEDVRLALTLKKRPVPFCLKKEGP